MLDHSTMSCQTNGTKSRISNGTEDGLQNGSVDFSTYDVLWSSNEDQQGQKSKYLQNGRKLEESEHPLETPSLCGNESRSGLPVSPQRVLSKDLFGNVQTPDNSDTTKMNVMVLGLPANGFRTPSGGSKKKKGKTPVGSTARKCSLRCRVACPRSGGSEEGSGASTKLENGKGSGVKRRVKKKQKMTGKNDDDEFGRMRRQLSYFLKRIKGEQNLLDAYSLEGWRGQSAEKLRPEKELERAKAEINRNKLKIRDLFQRIDSLSNEGKFPESLFDSDGLIDSEDIYCAKCGTKDSVVDNDIILCDGTCDRGFHQRCLEPPLRTEEIPPDDEGWLCPACDCKVDCLDLLNDSHGTNLSVEDSWEKVFPDIVAGGKTDQTMDLPSDDSEDNDYNPDGPDDDDDEEVQEAKSASDDSSDSLDFSSASDDLKEVCVNENDPYLGLPSEDSEDDDYNPDEANGDGEEDEGQSSSSEDVDREGELPVLENDEEMGEVESVVGRRNVERLDYKKLYDETYGNASSDSSDDEEWTETSKKKRKTNSQAGVSPSSIADTIPPVDSSVSAGTYKKRGQAKPSARATNGSPTPMNVSGSPGKKSPHNKIGDFATQKLYDSFKNNRYPDRDTKEKLAKEVGLTAKQVTKWFDNARWSFNHHRAKMEATMSAMASQSNTKLSNVCCHKTQTSSTDANEGDKTTSSTPRRSGRLNKTDNDETSKERKADSGAKVLPSSITNTLAPVDNGVSAGTSKRKGRTKPNAQATTGSLSPLKKSFHDKVEDFATQETSKERKGDSGAKVSPSLITNTLAPVENGVSPGTSKKRGRMKPKAQTTGSPSPPKNSFPDKIEDFATQKTPKGNSEADTRISRTKPTDEATTGSPTLVKKPFPDKIGDFATQKLYKMFKNNRYPDRDTKEKLAKELGLTVKQVIKWFENARRSFNHNRTKFEATMSAIASPSNTPHKTKSPLVGAHKGDDKTTTSTPRRSGRLNKTHNDNSNINGDTSNIQTAEAQVVNKKRKRSRI